MRAGVSIGASGCVDKTILKMILGTPIFYVFFLVELSAAGLSCTEILWTSGWLVYIYTVHIIYIERERQIDDRPTSVWLPCLGAMFGCVCANYSTYFETITANDPK